MMLTLTKAGRYEISGELGRGAMGVVYLAKDPVIGRTVAVKTLQLSEEGTGLTRAELLARFQTEARAAGSLTHPNIVVVYDAGEEDGRFFITMELVEGKSLQAQLDAGQMFPLPRVLRIMEQTCSALQFAHDRNIVHRDIKPANLMMTPDDTVKVTDFGTAKILQFGTVQQTAHVMGTPSYMSPEQIKGKVVDGRSDIFSLGVVLYEMLTGEKPFPGQNITTVIYKIVNEEPIQPREIDSSIHAGMNAIVMKALAKEPSERYQSCRELLEDLRNYRSVSVSANPNATLPHNGLPNATPAHGAIDQRELAAASRSLSLRTAHPSQTPAVRRTAAVVPQPELKKSSALATVLAFLFLLAVIVFGVQKIRPVFQAARQQNRAGAAGTTESQLSSTERNSSEESGDPAAPPNSASATAGDAIGKDSHAETGGADPAAVKNSPPPAPRANSTSASALSPGAAEYKGRIEQAAADQHLGNRLAIRGSGSTITLSGRLRPAEHSNLLKFLRNAPAGVQVVDDIQFDDTAASSASDEDSSLHPAATPGHAAIHILTNVIGATASFGAEGSKSSRQCQTPCSFSGLPPGNYSLQVVKSGFQPVQTVLTLDPGKSLDQKIQLEPLAQGIFISSEPPGADVFINGDKQPGQTPVELSLAPGSYNLVLTMKGYEPFSSAIQVRNDGQAKLNAELHPRSGNVAWVQVDSIPNGAEILIDGVSSGQKTPARVQIHSGMHNIALKLEGYRVFRTVIEASDGGTVSIAPTLGKVK